MTNKEIQTRYMTAIEKRSPNGRTVNKNYWLLNSQETKAYVVIPKNNHSLPEDDHSLPEDGTKKSKVKESKEKSPASGVRLFEIQAYINENRLNVNAEKFYNYYTERGWTINGKPVRDWQGLLNVWSQREKADYAAGWAGIDDGADPETLEINRRWKEARKKLKEAESNAAKNNRD